MTTHGKVTGCSAPEGSEPDEAELQYISSYFEHLLIDLCDALNDVLKTQKSVDFWRILVGPWLHRFIGYVLVLLAPNPAAEMTPPFRCVPASFDEFGAYTMILSYAQLVAADAVRAPVAPSTGQFSHPNAGQWPRAWRRRLKAILKGLHWFAQGILMRKTLLIARESYFPQSVEIKIWWLSRGRIRFDRRDYGWDPAPLPVDQVRRAVLAAKLKRTKTEPEATIRRLVPLHLPRTYLEGFDLLGEAAHRMFRQPTPAYFTCTAHQHDEVFKYHLGEAKARDARLLVAPHGGNHGIVQRLSFEDFERSIADRYCTWGWREDERTVPLPAPKLMGLRRSGTTTKDEILFVATSIVAAECGVHRLDYGQPCEDYLSWQLRFLDRLSYPLRRRLRFRTLRDRVGDSFRPLMKAFPEVRIENVFECGVSFRKRLASCRLFVCDHLQGTYAEALAAGKPSILFWDPGWNQLRSSAQPFFNAFYDCGILHYSPESAAQEVVKAYADVAAWWADPAKQRAVQNFRNQYLLMDDNAPALWTKFLLNEAGVNVGAPQP